MSATEPTGPHAGLGPEDVLELMDRQTEVLELIARAAPLREVLTGILASLEDLMPGARCSVLLLDRERGTLHHGAAPHLPPAYVAAIDGMAIGESAGSCGTAAALNAPVVASDVLTDVRWTGYRDAAAEAGLRSCWSTPIDGDDGRPVGTFAVYHRRPHTPSSREQMLVDRFTHLASIAIGHARLLEEGRARLEAETARRTAEELSHAKSELLAAVGHEARTPIQAIVGFAELLGTMDLDDARRREALDHIAAAAGHVIDLLSDVLDMSRLESNALPLALEPVRVGEAAAEVFGLLSARAEGRQVTLVLERAGAERGGDDLVLADRRRLRQVLLNLVTNAIRHGHVGGRVEVRVCPDVDEQRLQVLVEDDGPGIPPDLLDRVFTPFARRGDTPARTSVAPADEGAPEESIGLGLGLAHGLVVAMGGDLEVACSGPTGTSMRLRLRRADRATP
jgi:two-component system cell cycle sensor histidine kinase PleC